jgi:hypothetical protein
VPDILPVLHRVAGELDRDVATDDLVLIAIADPSITSAAGEALRAEGATYEAMLTAAAQQPRRSEPTRAGLAFPSMVNQLVGWAQGFAAGVGSKSVTLDHLLVALLWDPESGSSHLLAEMGIGRAEVLARMGEMGVRVPQAPLPEATIPGEMGDPVWFPSEDLDKVLDFLLDDMPHRDSLMFGTKGDSSFVRAHRDVPLDDLVKRARAS